MINFNTNIGFVLGYTRQYMAANPGVKPIVIVDYLQIIPPTDHRQSDKEKVDNIVRGLHQCSVKQSFFCFPIEF